MASLIYIPTTDPFAVFGIILLFGLIIVFLILLIYTARRSAQDARQAVRDQSRYQRLLQLHRKEEEQSLRRMEEGRGRSGAKAGPSIVVTAPSASSSKRSHALTRHHPSKSAITGDKTYPDTGDESDDQDVYTATTSLLRDTEGENEYSRRINRLPRALRVGPQRTKFERRQGYQQIGGQETENIGREQLD